MSYVLGGGKGLAHKVEGPEVVVKHGMFLQAQKQLPLDVASLWHTKQSASHISSGVVVPASMLHFTQL